MVFRRLMMEGFRVNRAAAHVRQRRDMDFHIRADARLNELLALFGCANEIAPLEELAKRAGELIYLTARKGGECAD